MLCVRLSPALNRELADYGWERRVSVVALVEQALQKGCHFPLSHLSPTDRLAGLQDSPLSVNLRRQSGPIATTR